MSVSKARQAYARVSIFLVIDSPPGFGSIGFQSKLPSGTGCHRSFPPGSGCSAREFFASEVRLNADPIQMKLLRTQFLPFPVKVRSRTWRRSPTNSGLKNVPNISSRWPSCQGKSCLARSAKQKCLFCASKFPFQKKAWRWYYQPDLQAIRVTLGTIKAHYLKIGDPAWLFVVAPQGPARRRSQSWAWLKLPEVVSLGGFTPNTFRSGFYSQREPGLLDR